MKRRLKWLMGVGMVCVLTFALASCGHEHEYGEWTVAEEAACDQEGVEKRECECGEEETRSVAAIEHSWNDATCSAPKTCTVCELTEGEKLEHTWNAATCTAAKTCSVCGSTEGEAKGHNWRNATCTKAKTCSVCRETEGKRSEHSWKEATCTAPKTCSVCNATNGVALGHTTTTGTCTRCKVSFGKWTSKYYVDIFDQPTDEAYVTGKDVFVGKFSNSATTDSLLYVKVLVDKDEVAFVLYEYGKYIVDNPYSRHEEYGIIMKDANGKQYTLDGSMNASDGDRIFVSSDSDEKAVVDALKGNGSVSFYIYNKDRPINTYLFSVETSNFSEVVGKVR